MAGTTGHTSSVSPEPAEVQAPLLRVFGAEPAEPKLAAQLDGFNLHTGTSFEAHERVALKRSMGGGTRRGLP